MNMLSLGALLCLLVVVAPVQGVPVGRQHDEGGPVIANISRNARNNTVLTFSQNVERELTEFEQFVQSLTRFVLVNYSSREDVGPEGSEGSSGVMDDGPLGTNVTISNECWPATNLTGIRHLATVSRAQIRDIRTLYCEVAGRKMTLDLRRALCSSISEFPPEDTNCPAPSLPHTCITRAWMHEMVGGLHCILQETLETVGLLWDNLKSARGCSVAGENCEVTCPKYPHLEHLAGATCLLEQLIPMKIRNILHLISEQLNEDADEVVTEAPVENSTSGHHQHYVILLRLKHVEFYMTTLMNGFDESHN